MAIQKLFTSLSKAASGSSYVGENGRIFYDPTKGFRISDGVTPGGIPAAVAVTAANIGDLAITGATISTANANEDLTLSTNGTGNINVYGSFKVHSDGIGSSVSFDAAANGLLTMTVPTLTLGQTGLLINGGSTATTSLPQVSGTTFRSVGNDGMTNTVAVDAFGTGAFPAFIHRTGRGTSAAPTATKNGDTIGRWGAVGWGDTNFVIDTGLGRAASDIRFVATEDFTDTHGGTQIQFYTSPNGGTHRTLSVTMDYTGITTGNIHSTNVFVSGNTISQGTTNLIGTVTTQGNLNVNGNLSIEGTSINTGTTLMIGNTTTVGTTTLTGDVTITGNVNTTGAAANFGTSNFNGALTINGPMSINNQISLTALGNIAFNDGTIQNTAAIKQINNGAHITGALGFVGNARILTLSVDATPTNTASTIVSRDAAGDIAVGNITATNINTTSVTGNTQIAGSMIIYGNLQVAGTTTSVNSTALSISSLTLTVANNASTGSQADSAAFLVGNNGEFADWTYDNAQAAWRSNVGVIPAQDDSAALGSVTRNWSDLYVGNAYVTSKLNVGTLPIANFNTVAQFTGNVSSWSQITNQNTSGNIYASTDFVAINDVGTDVANYIDVGINSSNNADPAYSIMKANDGYTYVNGGNLAIGTQTLGKDIVFFTDDTLASKEAGRVHLGRWILGGTDNGIDKLQVGGNVTVGNISATNLTSQFGILYANAATQANQITGANAAIVTANTALKAYTDNQITTANTGMKSYVDSQVTTLNTTITTANTNVVSYVNSQVTTLNTSISGVTTAWQANAAGQANQITGANTNISTNTTAIATLNANVGAYETYANSAITTNTNSIATLNANVGAFETYANLAISSITTNANANTAAYLSNGISTNIVTTGNISAGNVLVGSTTYSNLSITSTALAADFTIGQTSATGNLVLNRQTNFAKDARITGNIRYDQTQNNATVTQLTSKATAVTANGRTGQITTNNATLNKGAAVQFTVNNSYITSAKDMVIVNIASGATVGYDISVNSINAAGSFIINLHNSDSTGSGANAADTLVINFAVIKVN